MPAFLAGTTFVAPSAIQLVRVVCACERVGNILGPEGGVTVTLLNLCFGDGVSSWPHLRPSDVRQTTQAKKSKTSRTRTVGMELVCRCGDSNPDTAGCQRQVGGSAASNGGMAVRAGSAAQCSQHSHSTQAMEVQNASNVGVVIARLGIVKRHGRRWRLRYYYSRSFETAHVLYPRQFSFNTLQFGGAYSIAGEAGMDNK